MKRLLSHACAVTFFGALAIIPSACAENDQSIYILSVFAPPQNRQNGTCTYTADPSQPMMSAGLLDVGARDTYVARLLVGSQLIARGDQDTVRAESNRVHINGATVRVTDANGGAIAESSTLGSGFLEPQLNNASGYGVVGVPILDAPTVAKLSAVVPKTVIANIKVFGKTLGGVDLESGEYQFPIDLCRGCLISFASGDDKATTDVIECTMPLGGDNGGATTVLPCIPGQDETTPCQLCRGRPACESPVTP